MYINPALLTKRRGSRGEILPTETPLHAIEERLSHDNGPADAKSRPEPASETLDSRASSLFEPVRLGERLPYPNSRNIEETMNASLFASIKATDANLQALNVRQNDAKYMSGLKKAKKCFQSDAYNHTIPGRDLHARTFRDWYQANSLGGIEHDQDFRDFIREARFEEGREADEPDRNNVIATVKYADKIKVVNRE